MAYTIKQVETIAAKLRELPPIEKPKRQVSKQGAVKLLTKEIKSLQKRGYTLEQIADALRGEGLEITTMTLKNFLRRAKPAKKADTPPPPPRPAVTRPVAGSSRAGFTPRPDTEDL